MGETTKINIPVDAWTKINGDIVTGIFTNNSQHDIRWRIATAAPLDSDTFGHVIHPNQNQSFDLDDGYSVYVYGFFQDARIALTDQFSRAQLVNALVEYDPDGTSVDLTQRVRTSTPSGIIDNKNLLDRNREQYNEMLSGVLLSYTPVLLVFLPGEQIRGTGSLLPIGTINTVGGGVLNIDCDHNDFTVGMTITGQTSGATGLLTAVGNGSDIQHNYNQSSVRLRVGTGAGDYAIRETLRNGAYIPFKTQTPSLTFRQIVQKNNVVTRVGNFTDTDGIFLEVTETDIAFVVRTSTSGSPNDAARYPQSTWNIDRLDSLLGLNPSGLQLDITKAHLFLCPFLWQGVGPITLGLHIGGRVVMCHRVDTANLSDDVYMRTPTLPIRYEIRNIGVTSSATEFQEICSTIVSEGGYKPVGKQFAASAGTGMRTVGNVTLTPVFAIRLKNSFNGHPNRKTVKFIRSLMLTSGTDVYVEVRKLHSPVDIIATWTDRGVDSAVEYSTNITAATGRPASTFDDSYVVTSQGNKPSADILPNDFISEHHYLSQNFNSDNSEMFVAYAISLGVSANVRPGIVWEEFD